MNEELGQILSEAKEAAQQNPESKNPASQLGMTDVPAPESPGGVIAFGRIERTAIIALSGVRALATFAQPSESGVTTIDADKTLALRRYLFALALTSAADPSVWDLREGCILVRESKTVDGKFVADPSAFTAVLVKHSGEEDTFTVPTNGAPSSFLEAAKKAFFGEQFPAPIELAFDPGGARAAVSTKGGGNAGEPKKKEDFVKALVALPAYEGKEAELQKKKLLDLKKLWAEAQQQGGADAPASNDSAATGDGGTES